MRHIWPRVWPAALTGAAGIAGILAWGAVISRVSPLADADAPLLLMTLFCGSLFVGVLGAAACCSILCGMAFFPEIPAPRFLPAALRRGVLAGIVVMMAAAMLFFRVFNPFLLGMLILFAIGIEMTLQSRQENQKNLWDA